MRFAALPLLAVMLGFTPSAQAQQPTRRELRTRCLAQCERLIDSCINFVHRTAQECATVDQTCKQNCDTRYPPPPGEAPAALPPGTTLLVPPRPRPLPRR